MTGVLLPTALDEARCRTLELVAGLTDAQVETQFSELMSPLCWDLAHIAAYEDLWLAHRGAGLPLLRPGLAELYDAFETPRAVRGTLPLLDRAGALEYLAEVRARVETLDLDPFLVELVLRHEHQHDETMLQALKLHGLPLPDLGGPAAPPAPGGHTGLESVEIPAGPCTLGAPAGGFAYDNERPRHYVELPAFRIGRTPVTNATWATWTGEAVPGDPDAPVMCVSWPEAEAFARDHGARLPTEAEWEKAAAWDEDAGVARPYPWGFEPDAARANLDHTGLGPHPAGAYPAGASAYGVLGMLGDVWEWTATEFDGYPGFIAHPYREYSEVFFRRGYRVLRGGSWATRAHVANTHFRNWDLPQRRQIFSGVRLAWDA